MTNLELIKSNVNVITRFHSKVNLDEYNGTTALKTPFNAVVLENKSDLDKFYIRY